jgi:transposase
LPNLLVVQRVLGGMSTDASLPTDVGALQQELIAARHRLAHAESVLAQTAVTCEQQQTEIEKLKAELELFRRYLYGRRSERFLEDPAQGRLFEPPAEGDASSPELPAAAEEEIPYQRRRKGHGWSELPKHLPREEILLDVPEAERQCGCCGQRMVKIGEDRVERVDYRPAKIAVKVYVTPKYACPNKDGGVQQIETPPGPVPGGRFAFGMVAQVVTSKICDHLPLYRQQDVLARSGIELSRSTLCEIMASAARAPPAWRLVVGWNLWRCSSSSVCSRAIGWEPTTRRCGSWIRPIPRACGWPASGCIAGQTRRLTTCSTFTRAAAGMARASSSAIIRAR